MPDIFTSVISDGLTLKNYLICIAVSLVCGIMVAATCSVRAHITKSLLISLVILPAAVQTVIMMVNGNVGTGIAVAGAFSLVRFRSAPGKARDIAGIFIAMTAGLSCAAGYVIAALIFTVIVCAAVLVLTFLPVKSEREYELRITVPESLDHAGAFDDVFKEHTSSCRLVRVKTVSMGSLYKLTYRVRLKKTERAKEMIDDLRCRNGNLEISLSMGEERSEEL